MKLFFKLIFLVLGFVLSANASLINTAFVDKDIKILEELDIKSSYITDYKLQKELQKRLERNKNRYTQKLNNAYLFVPKIKKILKENEVPSAFLYLVMAESNFILSASSNKSAKGLWQFIPNTAKHYGLEKNRYIDERMDIVKSTEAAVKYLKRLHSMFGKWYLAAIAYNCGEGRVIEGITRATIDMHCDQIGYSVCRKDPQIKEFRRTIKKYQEKKVRYAELGKIYKVVKKWGYKPDIEQLLIFQKGLKRQYLPKESRNYIRKIIALAFMNNSDFLIKDENTHLLNRGISDPIAAVEVNGGVTMLKVAEITGISRKNLKELNLHIRQNVIPTNEKKYTLYLPYSKLSRFNRYKENLKAVAFEHYIVKSGDSLGKIANRFDIDYKSIMKYNSLSSNLIRIDQKLLIPVNPSLYKRSLDYIVKVGDTLGKISQKHKVDLDKLMKDNNLKTSMIKIGAKLVIKY
ncbi:MAG: LysM peptidoglycan-binding domain-containing protein [Campylobacterota bacterium]|nr:LysM peptidoglycan-binding domain-containing protein [Campylobacterota bacterium]